jgi:hypothetical protein
MSGGPSKEEVERQNRREINDNVAGTAETVRDMQIKRNFLKKRADKLESEGRAAAQTGDDDTAQLKAEEWQQVMSQIQTLDGILVNVRATHNAMDQTATNVNAFHVQKDAVSTLGKVNAQITVAEVDQVNEQLAMHIDDSQYISKAMARPVSSAKRGGNTAKGITNQWKMDNLKTPATTPTKGTATAAVSQKQKINNKHNNNNNNEEEPPIEEK